MMARTQLKLSRWLRLAILLATVIPLLAACGGGGSGATPGNTQANVTQDAHLNGKVSLGNVEGTRAYVAGVRLKATPLNAKTLSAARTVQSTPKTYETTADSNGNYSLTLPSGNYVVEAAGGSTRKALAQVSLAAGSTQSLDFVLTATGTIQGQLKYYSDDYSSTTVFIPGTSYIAMTDNTGKFTLSDVPVGTYSLQVGNIPADPIFGAVSITVVPGINDLGQIDLAAQKPTVIHASLEENQVVSPRELQSLPLVIDFSQPMDPASTEAALSTNPALAGLVYQWSGSNRILSITNFAEKVGYGAVNLAIGTGAQGQNGQKLDKAYSLDFTVDERVLSSFPSDGDSQAYLDSKIPVRVEFSTGIDRDTLQVSVTPQPLGGIDIQWESDSSLNIFGSFAMDTDYTVSIQNAGTAKTGRKIYGLPYQFSFHTAAPNVVATQPTTGALAVDPETSVSLSFNTLMDRDTVEEGLKVFKGDAATGEQVPAEDIKLQWGRGHYGDSLRIGFPMDYATKYTVALDGAKVLSGLDLGNYTLTFTTLTPRLVDTSPLNGGTVDQVDGIVLYFNSKVDISQGTFQLLDGGGKAFAVKAKVNSPTAYSPDVASHVMQYEGSCSVCHGSDPYYSPSAVGGSAVLLTSETQVPAGGQYTLSWSGLKAADGTTSIADGQFGFQTAPREILTTSPEDGAVNVALTHSVTIQFNDLLSEANQNTIESALTITSAKAQTGNVLHPDPLFIWDVNSAGNSRLLVNFTFDPATNYKLSFKADDLGNIVGSDGSSVMKAPEPIIFTTMGDDGSAPGSVNLLDSLNVNDGQVLVAMGSSILMTFNRPVNIEKSFLSLEDADGPVDLKNATLAMPNGTSYWIGDKQYSRYWSLNQDLPFSQAFTFTVKDATDVCSTSDSSWIYECSDVNQPAVKNNLPFTVNFASSAKIYTWVG